MIVIINGPLGVGKTSVSSELLTMFPKAVLLEGDSLGDVYPFQLYDEERIEYLYNTIVHLAAYHLQNGYTNFVIDYVFENEKELNSLMSKLGKLALSIHCFRLSCNEEEHRSRIIKRNRPQLDWELKRFLELNEILQQSSKTEFIGVEIDTSNKSSEEVAQQIFGYLPPEPDINQSPY